MPNASSGNSSVSDSTATLASSQTWSSWDSPDAWDEARAIRPLSPLDELKLAQRLAAFDRARTDAERVAAQRAILALGAEAVPSALAELSLPQPPDRSDVLLALLVKHESPDSVIELASRATATRALRAALADALARYGSEARSEDLRKRIATALLSLARDADTYVRSAAVDAIGLAGIVGNPAVKLLLEDTAEHDADPDVRAEARAILNESN